METNFRAGRSAVSRLPRHAPAFLGFEVDMDVVRNCLNGSDNLTIPKEQLYLGLAKSELELVTACRMLFSLRRDRGDNERWEQP